ncbi:hypothetical protein [Halosimplex amylolyticum]|uniref:hypothetical protein n=1 Tax=Halosimplex amylolyticum TaxID=3396616 RepID=UPI003F55359A
MRFIATLEHSPDNCWAREENQDKAVEWITQLDQRAEEHGVELDGAYATPTEHQFYFIMQADSFGAVTGFLGPPFGEDHDGHVAPVLTLDESIDAVIED